MKSKKLKSHRSNFFSWKGFSWTTTFVAIIGIIVGFSVNWASPKWIFIAGSSTMQPLLDEISKIYKPSEISANAGGSSYGINSVLNNKKNIGSVSKMPSTDIAGLPGQEDPSSTAVSWETNAIKTVTIGKDSIGVIYKDSSDITINETNIAYFYLAFCGNEKIYLNQLDESLSSSKYLAPFARSGGSNESGTAEAFLSDNNLGTNGSKSYLKSISAYGNTLTETSDSDESIYNVLSKGSYGSLTQNTNETSLETWEAIKNYSSKDGSGVAITYLSSGFIKNNYSEIISNGFKVAMYSSKNTQLIVEENGKYDISTEYSWFRPLNLVLKTKNSTNIEECKNLIQWILANSLFENSKVSKIYQELGFLTITSDQIKTMFDPSDNSLIDQIAEYATTNPDKSYEDFLKENPNISWDSLWKSDYELYTLEQTERDATKEYYGAILKG